MKIQEIVERAIKDPAFADRLAEKAGKAARQLKRDKVAKGDDWQYLLKEFAESPEELSRLLGPDNTPVAGTIWTTVTLTTTTTSTCTVATLTVGTTIL